VIDTPDSSQVGAGAGTLRGPGTVSNRNRNRGSACGDPVRMETPDRAGRTAFGAIEQRVVPA
jgi:hypothetical protein